MEDSAVTWNDKENEGGGGKENEEERDGKKREGSKTTMT